MTTLLTIKIIPKASKNKIVGWENDILKIRIQAVPEKGEANNELIAFLSKILEIPKSHLALVSGKTSRQKKLKFEGISSEVILAKIQASLCER